MKQDWKAVGSYGTVGLEVVLSVLVGLFIGRWLDARLGTEPVMSILWFFFGLAAGSKAIWRAWKNMREETAREEREQGNPAPMFEDEEKERVAKGERWEHPAPDETRDGASDEAERPAEGRDER